MLKTFIKYASPLLVLAVPAPAMAQDDRLTAENMMRALSGSFATEPLNAEEQARLPAARAVVEKIVPRGAMQELIGPMFDSLLGPMMERLPITAEAALAKRLRTEDSALGIGEERATLALAIIDPAWQEREQRERALFPEMLGGLMEAIEPAMKLAMSELYAINFDAKELAEIDQFFATETGAEYARKSFTMSADPRMTGAMLEAMPAIFAVLENFQEETAARTADLPAQLTSDMLTPAQREKLSELTGLEEGRIAEALKGTRPSFPSF